MRCLVQGRQTGPAEADDAEIRLGVATQRGKAGAAFPVPNGFVLAAAVRSGRPLGISGLPEEAKGPAFAVATGLLVYPQLAHLEAGELRSTRRAMTGTGGYFAKVGRWLRESF
jgi:cell division ATPase FtsA